jgi:hypothetical protein
MSYEKIQELFPHRCPSCNAMAYIGMNEVKCIGTPLCPNYSEEEVQRYVKLITTDEYIPSRDSKPGHRGLVYAGPGIPVHTWDDETDPMLSIPKIYTP